MYVSMLSSQSIQERYFNNIHLNIVHSSQYCLLAILRAINRESRIYNKYFENNKSYEPLVFP